jgi:methylated-DNA-[protein]-cysteine S-methyltransferase
MTRPALSLHLHPSPVGALLLVATPDALVGLWFDNERTRVTGDAKPVDPRAHPVLRATVAQLDEYFAGERRVFDLPLAPEGTPFQQKVWTALRDIAWGETCAYRDIAQRIGQPSAVRAVGLANGRNPISIIVPCHRVIGADGTLTGYGGGLPVKRALLALEGHTVDSEARGARATAHTSDLFGPDSTAGAAA